jgi:hypothetical protein
MQLKGTNLLLVYADEDIYIYIWGGSIHTIKKQTEASEVASNQTGLEVNAEKTKYMVMS